MSSNSRARAANDWPDVAQSDDSLGLLADLYAEAAETAEQRAKRRTAKLAARSAQRTPNRGAW